MTLGTATAGLQARAPLDDLARTLLERAFTRAAGAPLVGGNAVRLLKDAPENYPEWRAAIASAERTIYFESYILYDDDVGAEFGEALAARARAGVRVRLVYDWLGAIGKTSRRFWREIARSGVEVRCFNPPRFASPFGWLHRDHRKMLAVDGRVGFITGLCVGRPWAGDPLRGIAPWRDTGIEVRGPAVADIEGAFADVWATAGPPIPDGERVPREAMPLAGDVAVRVVATAPGTAGLLRLDQIVAAAAQKTLWLSDAYFAATPPYMQALRAAALDGVDVRLLVPGPTDIPLLRPLSQAGYRPLLEAGVRLFEWKGPMMHAKTAVADGLWARVGSSNLNIASWMGNYELDAVVEDESFALAMQRMFLDDLQNTTELVLSRRTTRRLASYRLAREPPDATPVGRRFLSAAGQARAGRTPERRGSTSRLTAGALRVGSTVGAAIGDRRVLAMTEAHILGPAGVCLLAFAAVAVLWPRLVAIPLAALMAWLGLALLARAYSLRRIRHRTGSLMLEGSTSRAGSADASPSAQDRDTGS